MFAFFSFCSVFFGFNIYAYFIFSLLLTLLRARLVLFTYFLFSSRYIMGHQGISSREYVLHNSPGGNMSVLVLPMEASAIVTMTSVGALGSVTSYVCPPSIPLQLSPSLSLPPLRPLDLIS